MTIPQGHEHRAFPGADSPRDGPNGIVFFNDHTDMFECIILAGGLGTRLRSVVADLPKCMAPVAGRPFLDILIDRLHAKGVKHIILSLGYLHDVIEAHIRDRYPHADITCHVEREPLGTGGAIRASLELAHGEDVFVFNGDTWFDVDLGQLQSFHDRHACDCTVALKAMRDFSRYGRVEIGAEQDIVRFMEKEPCAEGLINGGVYLIRRSAFLQEAFPEKFSFEADYLARYLERHAIKGMLQEGYFIDIGVPEDYALAQVYFV